MRHPRFALGLDVATFFPDICLIFGETGVEDMSRHLPRNVMAGEKCHVMSRHLPENLRVDRRRVRYSCTLARRLQTDLFLAKN